MITVGFPVAAELAPHGLAISSGDTKSVGVGGLTLTGGIGWKVRKYGLALDNVVAAEVVTASGDVVHASAEENPELFWAIRPAAPRSPARRPAACRPGGRLTYVTCHG